MLIEKNGVTRNIDEKRFAYYKVRGYVPKKAKPAKEVPQPKQEKTSEETAKLKQGKE